MLISVGIAFKNSEKLKNTNQSVLFVVRNIVRRTLQIPCYTAVLKMSSYTGGPIESAIAEALTQNLSPVHMEVINESYMHNVPKGAESHFKVLVVSDKFQDLALLKVKRIFVPICTYFVMFSYRDID